MITRTTPLIVGNWKATPGTLKEAEKTLKALEKKIASSKIKLPKKSYLLAVPEVFIAPLTSLAKHGLIGAQDVHGLEVGQHTGGSTPSQLVSSGASFTLIGHSEVRKQGETKEARVAKILASVKEKLTTVVCFGESKRDKEGIYLEELEDDIKTTLSKVQRELYPYIVIAYEPIWAIGAKNPATEAECFEAVIAIRRAVASLGGIDYAKKVLILYGGTVTNDNAKGFIEEGGVDGLLIGRASQDALSFVQIINTLYS
jgi:triosephosphate isomerase